MSPQPLQQVAHSGFRGLKLRGAPEGIAPNECLDGRDFVLDDTGNVSDRDGFAPLSQQTAEIVTRTELYQWGSPSTRRLLLFSASRAQAMNADGTLRTGAGLVGGRSAAAHGTCRYGQPGSSRVYAGNGVDTLLRYDDTSEFSTPTCALVNAITGAVTTGHAMPRARFLATWPGENRVVFAGYSAASHGPNGLATSGSTVWISEPGNPERFRTDATIDLAPGDGEEITGVATWSDLVFIFKETKFFVFTAVTDSGGGVPAFIFRTSASGLGCVGPEAVCAGRDGVYFVTRRGLYVSTGGDPLPVGADVEPLWGGPIQSFFTQGRIDPSQIEAVSLRWHNEKLYLAYQPEGATVRRNVLVGDLRFGWWAIWRPINDLGVGVLSSFRSGTRDELMVFGADRYGYRLVQDRIGDLLGSAATAHAPGYWLGGFASFDDLLVRIRQFEVWGRGLVRFQPVVDFGVPESAIDLELAASADLWGDGLGADTWGDGSGTDMWSSPSAIGGALARDAVRGSRVAHRFGRATSGRTWSVSRVVDHVAGARHPADIKE